MLSTGDSHGVALTEAAPCGRGARSGRQTAVEHSKSETLDSKKTMFPFKFTPSRARKIA